jgi:nitroreductase
MEDALVQSPSSYGLQPWKFLVIVDQSQITDCSYLVVFPARRTIEQTDLDRLIQAAGNRDPEDRCAALGKVRDAAEDLIETL